MLCLDPYQGTSRHTKGIPTYFYTSGHHWLKIVKLEIFWVFIDINIINFCPTTESIRSLPYSLRSDIYFSNMDILNDNGSERLLGLRFNDETT